MRTIITRDGEGEEPFGMAYDGENGGEFDIEMDHPMYDEFHQVSMLILETVRQGLRADEGKPPRWGAPTAAKHTPLRG